MPAVIICLCAAVFVPAPASAQLRAGEKLFYDLSFGILAAGTQVATVYEKTLVEGREAFHVGISIKTNPFFSLFYRLDNQTDSYIDCINFSLLKAVREVREGNRRLSEYISVDPDSRICFIRKNSSEETKDIEVPFFNTSSVPYFFRTVKLTKNRIIKMSVITDKGIRQYNALVGSTEVISTAAGRFEAFRVTEKNEKITVWISNDDNRLPVKIQVGLDNGYVTAILRKIE